MARNGLGTYTLPAGNPVVTGTTISSTVQNTTMTDVANALTTSIATDGQSVVTANIPMAGYKLTGIGAATTAGDALRYEQVLGSAVLPIANGGTAATTAPLARASLGVAPRATRIDVASVAGTVDLTTNAPDTDDIRITGALAITAFTVAIGRVVRVTAGGAFTLANNASIVTQTSSTLRLVANDTFSLRATAADTVEVIAHTVSVLSGYMARLNTANGYGSTNTKIKRFTNAVTSPGPHITYTDSATLGASFTVNSPGVYAVSYSDSANAAFDMGLSLNTSQPTTSIVSITQTDVLAAATSSLADRVVSVSWSGYLASGDVVRAHTDGAASGTRVAQFTITKTS